MGVTVTTKALDDLATAYLGVGKHDRAMPLFEQNLEARKTRMGPDDPATLTSLAHLASAYDNRAEQVRAEPLHREILAHLRKKHGNEHAEVGTWLAVLCTNLLGAEKVRRSRGFAARVPENPRTTAG